ncbi:hypothetical protein ABZ424_02735 [Streptomyces sp. NPDC005790]|uniref:hypothetical protein n=1 Tax=Streptomyces sp. NPDC005790 TaxID=3154777 RepID=UPI0033D9A7B1
MSSTDTLPAELSGCMAAMASDSRVYVRVGRFAEAAPDMTELTIQIHELIAHVFDDPAWKRFFMAQEPLTPLSIEYSLEPIEVDEAAAFMVSVATSDIVWPQHRLMDSERAVHAAEQVVSSLGQDATWWTNHDSDCGATNSVTPVFDSLIAGTNGRVFAMMIQVADD